MNLLNKKIIKNLNLMLILAIAIIAILISPLVFGFENKSINETQTNEKVNITILNETNATLTNETVNETVENISISKSIKIALNYKNNTIYDENNDGIETINGVVDLTVENTQFNWNIDDSKLCTRWGIYSVDTGNETTVCYGAEKCCNFVELVPTRDLWDDTFYITYWLYGATYNNTISAQVLYVDYNLSIEKPFAEVYYSSWLELQARFIEIPNITSNITKAVNETANIANTTAVKIVNKTIKQHNAVIGKPVKWQLRIEYSNATKANITLPDVINFTAKKITDDEEFEIKKESIKVKKEDKVKTFEQFELEGITAQAVKETQSSNLFSRLLNWLFGKINSINSIAGYAILGDKKSEKTEIIIEEPVKEIEIEYYTSAPTAIEEWTANGKKIIVSSEFNYTDILTFASITEAPIPAIKLYWHASEEDYKNYINSEYEIIDDGRKIKTEITNEPYFGVYLADENSNGLIDTIYWTAPHTPSQEFEISLTILNVQSYPALFGNWTVAFNTTGTANLTIIASNGTTYSEKENDNLSTINDLELLELKCGNEVLEPLYIVDSGNSLLTKQQLQEHSYKIIGIHYQNYNCNNKIGYHTVKVLTTGKHTQQFSFGSEAEYAYNDVPVRRINTSVEGILVYGENGAAAPRYRIWNGINLSAEMSAPTTGPINWTVVKAANREDEFIAVMANSSGALLMMIYNGTCWGNGTNCDIALAVHNPTAIGNRINTSVRAFDIAYENITGRDDQIAVIVYSNTSAFPLYRIWNSTNKSLSDVKQINNTYTNGGSIGWLDLIEMSDASGNNEIALVMRHEAEDDLSAIVWNATNSTWGCNITLDKSLESAEEFKDFGAAYRKANRSFFVAWSQTSANIKYANKTLNACDWGLSNKTSVAKIPEVMDVGVDEVDGNMSCVALQRVGTAVADNDNANYLYLGDDKFTENPTDGTAIFNPLPPRQVVACGGFGNGTIAVYSDASSTTIDYYTFNPKANTWNSLVSFTPNPTIGTRENNIIRQFPAKNGRDNLTFLIYSDSNSDLNLQLFNASRGIFASDYSNILGGVAIETTISSPSTITFDFAFRTFFAPDLTKPRINASIYNVSSPKRFDVVNVTANVSDETALNSCQFVVNQSTNGAKEFFNKTVTGTSDQCSQNITIALIRGNVINFTVVVSDLSGNLNQSEQIITIANSVPTPTILFPTNDLKTNQQPLPLNVTFNEADNDVVNITYYINGILNQTSLTNTTFNASDGVYILNVSLHDNVTPITYSANATVNFTIDTKSPNITLNAPVNIFNTSIVNITFNFTAIDNLNTILNCSLYINGTINQTNSSTLNGTATLFRLNNIAENAYKWNITCLDATLNSNTSERNFTIDLTLPSINTISFSPNSTDDVDPNVLLNFTINATDNSSAVKSVVLQYKQSGGSTFANATAEFNSATGLYYANFTPNVADTWNYRAYISDHASNNDSSEISNISVQSDRTWRRTPALFDNLACGFSATCVAGNLTINNTGDFTLNFDLSSNYGDTSFNETEPFDLDAKAVKVVRISLTAGTTASETNVVITTDATTSNAEPDSETTNVSFTASPGGPVFELSIPSAPEEVNRSKGEAFNLSSKLKNIGNQSATDIWVNWTLPENWYNLSGNLSKSISSIAVGETVYHNITANLTSGATTGTKKVIVNATSNSNVTKGASISIIVTETGTTTIVTVIASSGSGGGSGGGGGGGGGGGAAFEPEKKIETEAIYELVRGKDNNFTLLINNSFEQPLYNITADVTGFLSQYIEITEIPSGIPPNGSANLTVRITAPRYFTKGEWRLNFTIKGIVTKKFTQIDEVEKTERTITEIIHFSEKRAVLLAIHELGRDDASQLINSSLDEIIKLESLNLSAKKLRKLLADSEDRLKVRDYEGVQLLHTQIKERVKLALETYNKIQEFFVKIAEAKAKKIETPDTLRLVLLTKSALEREDYFTAAARLKEIELTFALETKGEFSIIDLAKKNPGLVSFIAFYILLFVISVYFKIKIERINYELRNLNNEKGILRGLMETTQRECFEKKTIDMAQYNTSMLQYENRLGNVVQRIVELESVKASLIKPALHRLELERRRLLDMIKQTQDEYIVKGAQETNVYKSKMRSYSAKLSEVEGKIVIKESEAAIKKEIWLKSLSSIGIKLKPREEKAEDKFKEKAQEELEKPSIIARMNLYFKHIIKRREEAKQYRLLLGQRKRLEKEKIRLERERKREEKLTEIIEALTKNKVIGSLIAKWGKIAKQRRKKKLEEKIKAEKIKKLDGIKKLREEAKEEEMRQKEIEKQKLLEEKARLKVIRKQWFEELKDGVKNSISNLFISLRIIKSEEDKQLLEERKRQALIKKQEKLKKREWIRRLREHKAGQKSQEAKSKEIFGKMFSLGRIFSQPKNKEIGIEVLPPPSPLPQQEEQEITAAERQKEIIKAKPKPRARKLKPLKYEGLKKDKELKVTEEKIKEKIKLSSARVRNAYALIRASGIEHVISTDKQHGYGIKGMPYHIEEKPIEKYPYHFTIQKPEIAHDGIESIKYKLNEASLALMELDLLEAKRIYIEILQLYNRLEPRKKAMVYNKIKNLYYERKLVEKYRKNNNHK